jgi:hypothetical protein
MGVPFTWAIHIQVNRTKNQNGLVEHWFNGEKVNSGQVPLYSDFMNSGGSPRLHVYRDNGGAEAKHWPMALGTSLAKVSY